MEKKKIQKLVLFYKVFADESRLKILFLLKEKKHHVNELTSKLEISQSAVSHQLQILRQLDLVKSEKKGKEIVYSLADHHIDVILNYGIEHIKEKKNG